MAKKSSKKAARRNSNALVEKDVSVSRQAVGGVTGAVVGAMVGGPVGALAGGVAGVLVGDQSARGKRPVVRAAEAIGEEVRKIEPARAIKSAASAATSLGRPRKKSPKAAKSSSSTAGGRKKAKSASHKKAAKTAKAKSPKKGAKAKKPANKKGAKKR
jgi:hypothetical protein